MREGEREALLFLVDVPKIQIDWILKEKREKGCTQRGFLVDAPKLPNFLLYSYP
jgi:hypothetical protein